MSVLFHWCITHVNPETDNSFLLENFTVDRRIIPFFWRISQLTGAASIFKTGSNKLCQDWVVFSFPWPQSWISNAQCDNLDKWSITVSLYKFIWYHNLQNHDKLPCRADYCKLKSYSFLLILDVEFINANMITFPLLPTNRKGNIPQVQLCWHWNTPRPEVLPNRSFASLGDWANVTCT